jgi:hypothetical protein
MNTIQRAAYAFGMGDHEIRQRARYAPEWIRRRMDADRQRRGLRPLWGDDATRRQAAAKARSLRLFITKTKQATESRARD